MEGARVGGTLTEGGDCRAAAGCDMVLICNQPEEAEKVLDATALHAVEGVAQPPEADAPARQGAHWSKLGADPEYLDAQTLLRNAFA